MPEYEAPRSDLARQAFLTTAAKTGQADIDAGNDYVTQPLVDDIKAFNPGFDSSVEAVTATLSGREKEVREKNEAIIRLIIFVHDLWEVLRRRVNRNKENAEVLTFYQLPLDGVNPEPSGDRQWLEMAENVVEGDAAAEAAGHPLMVNPSAAEVAVVRTAAQTEFDQVAPADRTYDDAQAATEALRPRADELIQEVMDTLRFTLRKLDRPSQRRIMRTYGATFVPLPGEPDEEPLPGPGDETP